MAVETRLRAEEWETPMTAFPEKMRELMRRKGMSQERLAPHIDVSQSSISDYSKGKHVETMEIRKAKRFAQVFDVPLDWLFDDQKDMMSEEDLATWRNVRTLVEMLGLPRAYARLAKIEDPEGGQGRGGTVTPLPRPTLQGPRHEIGTGTEPSPRQGGHNKGGGSRRSSG